MGPIIPNSYSEYNSWNQLTRTMQNGKPSYTAMVTDWVNEQDHKTVLRRADIWDGTNIAADVSANGIKYYKRFTAISPKKGSNENFYTITDMDVVQP